VLLVGAVIGWLLISFWSNTRSSSVPSPLPHPPPADLQRLSDLAFWDIAIERKPGSTITHAVARVLNESQTTRYGVDVQLEIADGLGRSLGTARDYIERLEPGQDGHIRALVIKRDAATARIIRVTEE
jgi:hypothetical protein